MFSTIPGDLQARPQWIVWRSEERRGKLTKAPYAPGTDRHARSNDPGTWRAFDQAVASYQRDGFDGIGYVFSADDGLTGIDLDKCAGDYGVLEPWALRIVQEMNSYAEWSPGGRGVHVIVRAKLPPGGRRKDCIEMYDRLRFFTMTGRWLPITPLTVESRQAEVDALHARVFPRRERAYPQRKRQAPLEPDDVALIRKAREAGNGIKFSQLWHGDFADLYPSQSEADLALCSCLAYWTGGDSGRMDRLFRQSGLYRLKWDERHCADGRTYGQMTIERALQ
jgi:putative DNA primase/helicase